jgi:hypothetical protein
MTWLPWLMFGISFFLHLFVVASLWRGAWKSYPFVLAYCLLYLATSIGEAAMFGNIITASRVSKAVYFYRVNALRDFLLFAVVVSLIEHAMSDKPYRLRIRYLLGALAVVAVGLSLLVHSDAGNFILWMTQVARDLSFGSAVLTLLLWSILVVSRGKDRQMLMVTGGLGLQFTGEAIGQSLRQLSTYGGFSPGQRHGIMLIGNLLLSAAHVMRLYVWWEAFRGSAPDPRKDKEPDERVTPFRARQAQQTLLAESV